MVKLIVPLKLWCPHCGARHIDESRNGERWDRRAHTTHRCQGCGSDFDVYVSGATDDETNLKGKVVMPDGKVMNIP